MPTERDYLSRRDAHRRDRAAEDARQRRLGWARLAVAASAVVFMVAAWRAPALEPLELPVLLAHAAVFVYLVRRSNQVRERVRWHTALAQVEEEAAHRVARRWDELPLLAPSSAPETHGHARDLHLFGRMSLFQLLGTTGTAPGRLTVRDWLLAPAPPADVPARQEAVRELAPLAEMRSALAARGRLAGPVAIDEVERFCRWAESEPWLYRHRLLLAASWALPPLIIGLFALAVAGIVNATLWLVPLAISMGLTAARGSRVRATLDAAFARESPVRHYGPVLAVLESLEPRAELLRALHARLGTGDEAAHRELDRLGRLADYAHVRWSPMAYLLLQTLLLWDFHVLAQLERWQRRAGPRARGWLSALGEIEALCALASLAHDNPEWAFPDTGPQAAPTLVATALAHPLLPAGGRVANDVTVGPPGSFLLVTGSNMSGKTTLLRAIGVNVVLAQCGAPVCAAGMRVPPVRLETSVHVEDSLALGLSRFVAELTRLKEIVEAARTERRTGERTLLYLMDEMLQGTNSDERQVAARRVIGFLLEQGAIGVVTTHDLALGDAPGLATAAHPVHFRETVRADGDGPAMTFDYRLRPGAATSVNALRLMALIGLGEHQPGAPAVDRDAHAM